MKLYCFLKYGRSDILPSCISRLIFKNTYYFKDLLTLQSGLPWWLSGKESSCQCMRCRFDSWIWKIPWRRKWPPTPVFLPGKSHGQRDLEGTVHGVTKESDMTEQLNNNNFIIFKCFAPKKSEK